MRVLVTGGTGVVGAAAVTALLARGHEVRLLARHAKDDARQWPEGVEAWDGSVAEADQLRGAADGCEAVLHCAGIVTESPPDVTFERVNVEGTRHIVAEAARAGVPHFVYVSSLGSDIGESPYHRSKLAAEEITRTFAGSWVILRPGNVYGPGDEVVSLMLTMVRTLPAVPVVGGGDQAFEPVWVEDLAPALAQACEQPELAGRVLELAGSERTSQVDLYDRLSRLTGRSPARLPLPSRLASFGAKLAGLVGIDLPVNESQLQMLDEENVVRHPDGNALVTVFGVTPTPLEEGLRRLADAQPEQLPEDGVGSLARKRFWADIRGSRFTAEALLDHVRHNFQQLTPWHLDVDAEPDTPSVPEEGMTLTMQLPMRGHIQVRVEEMTARRMTFVTLAGHPLAGAIRFGTEVVREPTTSATGQSVRFTIDVWDRAANIIDWVAMATLGGRIQDATWLDTVQKVIEASGGEAPAGVQHETRKLEGAELDRETDRIAELVLERKREANADAIEGASADESPEAGVRARKDGDVSRPTESTA